MGRSLSILKFLVLAIAITVFIFSWESLPIISGYGAKVVCSGVFVAGKKKTDVIREDLASFPMNLASCTVDEKDSSVTASVWGWARRKAIYRRGLGATLVSGLTEEDIRRQRMDRVEPAVVEADTMDWLEEDRGVEGRLAGTGVGARMAEGEEMARIDTEALKAAVGLAFGQGVAATGTGTRAVVVVYRGKIVMERYAPGFDRFTRLAGWSMTKGVTGALIGILVGQGKLDVQQPAPVEAWANDDRSRIRLDNLLHMNSGLSWWELYAGPGNATRMLFEEGNMGEYAERSWLRHPPGNVFNYSSGTANILSAIIRSKVGVGYYRWPYEQLFYKIGMYSAVLEPDAGGTFVGSSYCYATARDWARFGLLYLRDGIWAGQRILPAGWVDYTKKGTLYGALWWLNKKRTDGHRRFPAIPEDCFSCEGYEGQYLWVIPSKELVIVRLAMEHGRRLNPNVFVPAVLAALR